jgi:hypothetical protein
MDMTRKTLLGGVALTAFAVSIAAAPVAAAGPGVRATVTDGTLLIEGSPASDHITLRVSRDDRTQLQVVVGDDGSAVQSFDLNTFDAVDVEAGNGNDTVKIDEVNGNFTKSKPTRIDGQNGDDTLLGGSGNEVLVGGRGDDVIDGNGGTDTAFLGQGDDTFVWDPGDGSDVVEGGAGFDKMVFNGAGGNEIMAATANFGRVSFTRNLGGVVMDLNGVEAIDVNALGGTDSVTVNDMSGTDLRRVNVDLAGTLDGSTSDGQADTVTVAGTKGDDSIAANANGSAVDVSGLAAFVQITHADPDKDSLIIDPVTGTDHVVIDPAVQALIQASVLP